MKLHLYFKRLLKLFKKEDWSRWYKKGHNPPEKCFSELISALPASVDSVIDFGCAAGRNLIPFMGKHKLYGVDIVPREQIEWEMPEVNYLQTSLARFDFSTSLESFVCISSGALMYLKPHEQLHFLSTLKRLGCKNFIFQEYDLAGLYQDNYCLPSDWKGRIFGQRSIAYPLSNPFHFEKKWFRPSIPTWIQIE